MSFFGRKTLKAVSGEIPSLLFVLKKLMNAIATRILSDSEFLKESTKQPPFVVRTVANIEWDVKNGVAARDFFETETGLKMKLLSQDMICNSVMRSSNADYCAGLHAMYEYFTTYLQSPSDIEGQDMIEDGDKPDPKKMTTMQDDLK